MTSRSAGREPGAQLSAAGAHGERKRLIPAPPQAAMMSSESATRATAIGTVSMRRAVGRDPALGEPEVVGQQQLPLQLLAQRIEGGCLERDPGAVGPCRRPSSVRWRRSMPARMNCLAIGLHSSSFFTSSFVLPFPSTISSASIACRGPRGSARWQCCTKRPVKSSKFMTAVNESRRGSARSRTCRARTGHVGTVDLGDQERIHVDVHDVHEALVGRVRRRSTPQPCRASSGVGLGFRTERLSVDAEGDELPVEERSTVYPTSRVFTTGNISGS